MGGCSGERSGRNAGSPIPQHTCSAPFHHPVRAGCLSELGALPFPTSTWDIPLVS